jgi:hypothetical protein
MFGYRGILLIRNPYDALISYWNFVETRDHRGLPHSNNFNADKWENFVLSLIPKWSSMITTWVENSQNLLILEYEKLKKNPHSELIRILDYLDLPVNEERLTCILDAKNIEGPVHRRHKTMDTGENSVPFFLPASSLHSTPSKTWKRRNNPLERQEDRETKESETEKNELEQNAKSWNETYSTSRTRISLIVQNNVNTINRFFEDKNIPIFLDYSGPTKQE